jgi:hypothetical protein
MWVGRGGRKEHRRKRSTLPDRQLAHPQSATLERLLVGCNSPSPPDMDLGHSHSGGLQNDLAQDVEAPTVLADLDGYRILCRLGVRGHRSFR